MDNLWKYLTTVIALILYAIAIVVYESIKKGDEYIFKIIAFSLGVILMVFVNIPYFQDAIENETTNVIAEYVKYQPGRLGTQRLFFVSDKKEIKLEDLLINRPVAHLEEGKIYEIEYYNNSKLIKEYREVK
ncbi:MAG: hypothetical protein IKM40_02615 [Clostridia bacterium]|nr:hypothetical protein [Clostridia bacterium]